ncbi:hypothetical protein D6C89_06156 [Aureobasidium pullulans]|nr:hypothetical protein D6C89_06156 [Aureobasidium pullulans]
MPFDLQQRWDAYTGVWESVGFGLWRPHFSKFEEEQTPVPRLIESAKGVILELGPGSGNQIPRFRSSAISKIYAVEPNAQFIPILVQRAKDHGLDEKYIVINAALEDEEILATHRIVDGSIDTVVCMQVLCSVPDARAAAKRIWKVLKPGGQLVYWEHQCSRDGVTRWVQSLWDLIRKPLMGGCYLDRDIEDTIMSAGAWEIVEMGRDGDDGYDLMPRCWGRLRKPVE